MFAVPGWSLGTPKTEEPTRENHSRKRKRSHRSKTYHQHTSDDNATVQTLEDNDGRTKRVSDSESDRKFEKSRSRENAPLSRQPLERWNIKQRSERNTPSPRSPDTPKIIHRVHPPGGDAQPKLTPMQAAMRQKLVAARFRHLNQTLYTTPSTEAQALFDSNPAFFDEYHAGFRQQVSSWPENPVDSYIQELKDRGNATRPGKAKSSFANSSLQSKAQSVPLPRAQGGICTVADLGCGDGQIADQLQHLTAKLSLRILSFDLHCNNHLVTKADISNVPLEDGSVNVAILCLALMGTNWISFIEEAWRILHWKGELWVAEIKSRFDRGKHMGVDHSVGKRKKVGNKHRVDDDDVQYDQLQADVDGFANAKGRNDISAFVQVLARRGFVLQSDHGVDVGNKMFVKLRFSKIKVSAEGSHADVGKGSAMKHTRLKQSMDEDPNEALVLKPCLYKTR